MKRSLLLAAVATLASGAALAQSSVTVYGRLNASRRASEEHRRRRPRLGSAEQRLAPRLQGHRRPGRRPEGRLPDRARLQRRHRRVDQRHLLGPRRARSTSAAASARCAWATSPAKPTSPPPTTSACTTTTPAPRRMRCTRTSARDNNKIAYRTPGPRPASRLEGAVSLAEGAAGQPTIARRWPPTTTPARCAWASATRRCTDGDSQFGVRGLYELGAVHWSTRLRAALQERGAPTPASTIVPPVGHVHHGRHRVPR